MPDETFILTARDFSVLEALHDRIRDCDDPLLPILRRKIGAARVVLRDAVPPDVATLNSRVAYAVDGSAPDTRVIATDHRTLPMGMVLPITSRRGLALLGLSEGAAFMLGDAGGRTERIVLRKVLYQPEAARHVAERTNDVAVSERRRPVLKLVRGALAEGSDPQPA